MGDEVEPTFAVANAFIGKAAVFVGQREERFAKEGHLFGKDRQFPFLRPEQVPFYADDVAEIEFFLDEFDEDELFWIGLKPTTCV